MIFFSTTRQRAGLHMWLRPVTKRIRRSSGMSWETRAGAPLFQWTLTPTLILLPIYFSITQRQDGLFIQSTPNPLSPYPLLTNPESVGAGLAPQVSLYGGDGFAPGARSTPLGRGSGTWGSAGFDRSCRLASSNRTRCTRPHARPGPRS